MDFNPTPYDFSSGLTWWLLMVGRIAVICVIIGIAVPLLTGHRLGGIVRGFRNALTELFGIAPRRVYAVARLTIQEAVRRRVLLIGAVFAVLLMFGGWFMFGANRRADLQAESHIDFVFRAVSWLLLLPVIYLASWAIPEDIRVRSIHTVVTKPIRRAEIVLGRMIGLGLVTTTAVILMGIIGYIWINRQIDPSVRSESLICRVPVYGNMFFLDRQGLPKDTGINVGDVWRYRSHIEGNTRARAVYIFRDVNEDRFGEQLKLESRFESFRTIKGSEESQDKGLEAQYVLVNNPREDAFSVLGVGVGFQQFADQLREGRFNNAAASLSEIATRLRESRSDFPPNDCRAASVAMQLAAQTLPVLGVEAPAVVEGFQNLSAAVGEVGSAVGDEALDSAYESAAVAAEGLASAIADSADTLLEQMPGMQVPLEPFYVKEYHEGENTNVYSRKQMIIPDYETQARLIASVVSEAAGSGGVLISNGEFSADAAVRLAEVSPVSELNAELLVDVLRGELESGELVVQDVGLQVADGRSWLRYFDQLVRAERLTSADPEGWKMEVDIFDDLVRNGVLRVEVACLDDQMFIGMARPDLFIHLPHRSFAVGYFKALLNVSLMFILIVAIAVTASCLVKGPVCFFLTLSFFVVGIGFHDLMDRITSGQEERSGLIESAVMIVQHKNPQTGMDVGAGASKIISGVDSGFTGLLATVQPLIPDFRTFTQAGVYVQNGFDVPFDASVLPALAVTLGFLIPCVLLGSLFLKFRELEAK